MRPTFPRLDRPADIGWGKFKQGERVSHEQAFNRKERGSHSVPALLTKEAERVKQNRVRTILAVLFLAVEKIALHKLPALRPMMPMTTSG